MNIVHGDCLEVMRGMEANSVDAIVTDPPYGLSFMGKNWDHGIPGVHFWEAALKVAKPGCHLLAFGGTRTFHRLTCAIEDAGWEIRDCLGWIYGSGFPKSHDVSKAIDKAAGAERKITGPATRHGGGKSQIIIGDYNPSKSMPYTESGKQWEGWGTALKPAWEPIILARKPLDGTVAANVLKWGTGAINVDGCRVDSQPRLTGTKNPLASSGSGNCYLGSDGKKQMAYDANPPSGRWPANIIHDGSEEVLELFPQAKAGVAVRRNGGQIPQPTSWDKPRIPMPDMGYGDSGSAARFFYCAKASRKEREMGCEGMDDRRGGSEVFDPRNRDGVGEQRMPTCKNHHPTVKPLALMRYLCRLVTPPNGLVLDPFCGSGSTGIAAEQEGFRFIGIDNNAEYVEIAERRIAFAAPSRQVEATA